METSEHYCERIEFPSWFYEYYPHPVDKIISSYETIHYKAKHLGTNYTFMSLSFLQKRIKTVKIPLQKLTIRHAKAVINEALDLPAMGRLHGGEINIDLINIDTPAIYLEFADNKFTDAPFVFFSNRLGVKYLTLASTQIEALMVNDTIIGYIGYDPENEKHLSTFRTFIENNIDLFKDKEVVFCIKDSLAIYTNPSLPTYIAKDGETKKATSHLFLDQTKLDNDIETLSSNNQVVSNVVKRLVKFEI